MRTTRPPLPSPLLPPPKCCRLYRWKWALCWTGPLRWSWTCCIRTSGSRTFFLRPREPAQCQAAAGFLVPSLPNLFFSGPRDPARCQAVAGSWRPSILICSCCWQLNRALMSVRAAGRRPCPTIGADPSLPLVRVQHVHAHRNGPVQHNAHFHLYKRQHFETAEAKPRDTFITPRFCI